MRILSQEGLPFVDAPYKNMVLHLSTHSKEMSTDGIEIFATDYIRDPQLISRIIFAKYSTEDKAKQAIYLLHKKYKTVVNYLSPNKSNLIPPKVFQFPTEKELDNMLSDE